MQHETRRPRQVNAEGREHRGETRNHPLAESPRDQQRCHVVLAEFEQSDGLLLLAQARARDQVLVDADRTIDLAAPAEQVAEGEVGFHRIAIDVGELEEYLDRLVLLFVEQVVEAAEIAGRQLADARPRLALAATPAEHPA